MGRELTVNGLEIKGDACVSIYIDNADNFNVECGAYCDDGGGWSSFPAELVEQLVVNWRNKQTIERITDDHTSTPVRSV